MSLYDGLDIDDGGGGGAKQESKPDVSGWGSSIKLMQTQKEIQAKKQSMMSSKRKGPTVAPVVDLKRSRRSGDPELYFNQQTGKLEVMESSSSEPRPRHNSGRPPMDASPFIGHEAPLSAFNSSFLGVSNEYDPLRPNEYEEFVKKQRDKRAKEREEERKKDLEEREKRRRERHRERRDEDEPATIARERRRRNNSDEEGSEEEKDQTPRRGGGAAIAPPQALIEEDKQPGENVDETIGATMGLSGSVASKIMARMGYKTGQGLGREGKGMSTALVVEKTSKRGGKIIHERDLLKAEQQQAQKASNALALKNPSKVVLLLNMVGPGEVDEELEGETTEECQKYGKVTRCVIFEIPDLPDYESVRIFLEFEKVESAIKALIDLNGRFFAGKQVRAVFYNQDKFWRLDLSDPID